MIGIVDYGMGNLRSVRNALAHLGVEAGIVSRAEELARCARLILPGVGAYARAMDNLRALELVNPLRERVAAGVPLLGICLGMQLLSTHGDEPVRCDGLNLIPGHVGRLDLPAEFHLPHVGWNNLALQREHPVFRGVKDGVDFYFVHSYHFEAGQAEAALALTDYGKPFVSAVARDNIVAFQFHPEKSQDNGLRLLENFCVWDGSC